jgi:restriction endonuclease S subunit
MEIKPGYKLTEVGMIPEVWDVKPLSALADRIMVGIASAATHAYRSRGIVLFRNQNIKSGYLDDSDILHIASDYEVGFKNKRLKAGDLLTARTGYPGTTCVVPPRYEGAQSFTTLITRPNERAVDSNYLCCFINSNRGQTYFERNQIGGGQKNVNAGSLKRLPVALPPTQVEQKAIAAALSDADALIESLDQLIAKKRHLKQGAMQDLLTGKKRLPGFSMTWDSRPLGSIIEALESGVSVNSVDEDSGEYPYEECVLKTSAVSNGQFFPHECKKIASRDVKRAKLNPRRNTIIISRMNTPDLVGECGFVEQD